MSTQRNLRRLIERLIEKLNWQVQTNGENLKHRPQLDHLHLKLTEILIDQGYFQVPEFGESGPHSWIALEAAITNTGHSLAMAHQRAGRSKEVQDAFNFLQVIACDADYVWFRDLLEILCETS